MAKEQRSKKALPPDPENYNDDRSKWAGAALDAFQAVTATEDDDKLADLLVDLMHWCDRHNTDFAYELKRARTHYQEETDDRKKGT